MRKTKRVVVPADWGGRDAGKTYLITEMTAAQAEKWALRLFVCLKGSEAAIPQSVQNLGMVGIAIVGLNAFLQAPIAPEQLEPLMDEMLACVQMCRIPSQPDLASPIVTPDDIEEVKTRLWLRSEVLELHTGFSPADALSELISTINSTKPLDS